MRPYIVNLTNHLIAKNKYDEAFRRLASYNEFITFVQADLEADDVYVMSPAKLGEIMCTLEIGDVMTDQARLLNRVHFSGDTGDLLRSLVSACLAYAILERLDGQGKTNVPQWKRRGLPLNDQDEVDILCGGQS